jgi:hypothetical protein
MVFRSAAPKPGAPLPDARRSGDRKIRRAAPAGTRSRRDSVRRPKRPTNERGVYTKSLALPYRRFLYPLPRRIKARMFPLTASTTPKRTGA